MSAKRKLFIVNVEAPELVVYVLDDESAAQQARDVVTGLDYKHEIGDSIDSFNVRPYNGLPVGYRESDLPWGEDVTGPDGKELTIGRDREPDEPEPRKPLPGQLRLDGDAAVSA